MSLTGNANRLLSCLYHVAAVSGAALNALVNGQSDAYTKHLFILKIVLSR